MVDLLYSHPGAQGPSVMFRHRKVLHLEEGEEGGWVPLSFRS